MSYLRLSQSLYAVMISLFFSIPAQASVDSYRYLHVNIDTPWAIFVFIFALVFAPMILLIILHWWHATKKDDEDDDA